MNHRKQRIVVTTYGSLGDLFPYVAIALELQARGYELIVGTAECYRQRIEALGLGFRPVRPDCDIVSDPVVMRRLMHPNFGIMRFVREVWMPGLRAGYEDTLKAVEGVDLIIANTVTFASRLVAERMGIPWISAIHAPCGFFSAYQPPLMPGAPGLSKALRFLGPSFWRPAGDFMKWLTRGWAKPWLQLRAEIGLPPIPSKENPLVDTQSPGLHLALFSNYLAPKQADWPPQTVVSGFPWYEGNDQTALPRELERFLEAGPPPIVFTLGSAVATTPGSFYEVSAQAARRLGCRAVLIFKDGEKRLTSLPPDVIAVPYASFAQLFPRAAAIVHHGGIGTTGLGLRSGRPTLIVPWSWDQPDNAWRAARLGTARVLYPGDYKPAQVAAELRYLLVHPRYSRRAEQAAKLVDQEDGVRSACEAIEASLSARN